MSNSADVRPVRAAARAACLAAVLGRHCAGAMVDAVTGAPGGAAVIRARWSDRAVRAVADAGPAAVKAAQLLASRRDVLPERVCAVLARLADRVPGPPSDDGVHRLREAYGEHAWPFATVDPTPVGAGSIATVYRARLHDGTSVAVKLRRPGVAAALRQDFALLGACAGLVAALPGTDRLPVEQMVAELAAAVCGQADLTAEGEALAALRRNLSGAGVLVPRPLPELGAEGVLVMEWVDVPDGATGRLPREVAPIAARRVLSCAFRMLFVDGVVHCDMHSGNLLIGPGGDVVLLDAGFVVELGPRVRREFAAFFLAMSRGNGARCAETVIESARGLAPGADLDGFRRGMCELVGDAHGRAAGEFSLGPFAARLFDLQRRHGVFAAPEFVFPLLSLLVIEQLVRDLDPLVDFQQEARPALVTGLLTVVPRP